jgi:hypothetical protein
MDGQFKSGQRGWPASVFTWRVHSLQALNTKADDIYFPHHAMELQHNPHPPELYRFQGTNGISGLRYECAVEKI